jgi:hypothetical protein
MLIGARTPCLSLGFDGCFYEEFIDAPLLRKACSTLRAPPDLIRIPEVLTPE